MICEPRPSDLASIAAEWRVIEAELAVVDAECRLAASPDPLAVRRHRRAVARLARVTRANSAAATRIAIVALPGTAAPSSNPTQSVSA
ncbi:hypothetical protein GCM10027039_30370 [Terrabacter koreensis]